MNILKNWEFEDRFDLLNIKVNSRISTISSVPVFDVTIQTRFGSKSEVAVRALEWFHTAVLPHVHLQFTLVIGAVVAQRTLEATRTH